jgi:hypothetical protein
VLPDVTFEGRDIPYNTETKFLGIYINEYVKWNNHIKHLSSKLNTSYYMISSLKNVVSPYVLRTMYFACFHVHLRYGVTLWGGDPESTGCVSESGDFSTLFFHVWQHWGGCRYCHFATNFKAF